MNRRPLDEWGGPTTYPMYHMAWAIAFNSPFALSKQVAGDFVNATAR